MFSCGGSEYGDTCFASTWGEARSNKKVVVAERKIMSKTKIMF
jgi:hypothetical protein